MPQSKSDRNALLRARRRTIRLEGIAAYGGVCSCCGEHRKEFLTIEHLNDSVVRNGDTYKGGRKMGGNSMWAKLKRLGWPKIDYTIMCHNCNYARNVHGVCPHQKERWHP